MDLGQVIIPITPSADLSMEPALVLKRKTGRNCISSGTKG
ncbi:hypothetical protein NC651_022070 [Populus alba x Populus x berolinensis]|nr:hypothetical protein NC651_022058 [Populus alba x Populus x berolinensis]KAJ6895733.1 hypothetical protein NC651_022070 [Populus alba x Populus x berolinensis]